MCPGCVTMDSSMQRIAVSIRPHSLRNFLAPQLSPPSSQPPPASSKSLDCLCPPRCLRRQLPASALGIAPVLFTCPRRHLAASAIIFQPPLSSRNGAIWVVAVRSGGLRDASGPCKEVATTEGVLIECYLHNKEEQSSQAQIFDCVGPSTAFWKCYWIPFDSEVCREKLLCSATFIHSGMRVKGFRFEPHFNPGLTTSKLSATTALLPTPLD